MGGARSPGAGGLPLNADPAPLQVMKSRVTMHSDSSERRLRPRLIDTDWLVLRGMRPAIEAIANKVVGQRHIAIDFGCGSQPYRSIFESLGAIYRGADFAHAEIAIDGSGRVDAHDGSADLVLSFQVLEHVRDPGCYLGEARRILRNDGRLILSTHGSWFYHPHPEDHRRWTRQGLVAELAVHGFETEECIAVLGPLAWTTLLRLTMAYPVCLKVPIVGKLLASTLALVMNLRGYVENMITPTSVTQDNACVYITLSRLAERQ
jgi:SAM-dependent methyltransferase